MKIAAVTEDGVTISQHFGRAPYYVVLTIADGQVVAREQREKVAHGRGVGGHVHVEGQAPRLRCGLSGYSRPHGGPDR